MMRGKGDNDDLDLEPEQVRKLFIGGLDYATTEETLEAYFERWGNIVDLVVMKDPYTKRSRGFGFVTYSHSEMVDEAMSHRPHKIDGREVETKRAIPKEEIEHIPQQAADVKKVFVGGLKHLEEQDLLDHFSQFGEVLSCDIILDRNTGAKRGFAFVEFDDTDAADKVILHQGHDVKGVRMFVKKAVEYNEMKRNEGGFRSRDGGFRGRGRGGGGGFRGRDDYYERRDSYRDDYDDGRRRGRGGRGGGGFRGRDYDRDDSFDRGYGGRGGRGGGRRFRDEDDWEERPNRRFREDSMERDYGGERWDDGPKKSSWRGGGGDSWQRDSPDRDESGYGGGKYGGGPVRSNFRSNRSAPYGGGESSYLQNRRGRY